jgi:hypothetical protein
MTKQILVRFPDDIAAELEQVAFLQDLSQTEVIIQGAVIRMRMPGQSKLPALLERLGYQQRRPPGRPKSHADGSAPETAPEQLPAAAAAPLGDGWDLEAGA